MRHLVAVLLCALFVAAHVPAAVAQEPPRHFRMTAAEAIEKARESDRLQRLGGPPDSASARTGGVGRWVVTFQRGATQLRVGVEDRTGDILEVSPWGWVSASDEVTPFKRKVEIGVVALSILLLVGLFRPPLRLAHLDLLAIVALAVSLFFFDRGHILTSFPLVYPPLVYLLARMIWRGLGRARDPGLESGFSTRTLLIAAAVLLAARVVFDLAEGQVTDVGYASMIGADGIHHGYEVYAEDSNHLDTYGPVAYLAYLPFEFVWPFPPGWPHDYVPGARAAAITWDLLTAGGLFLLGRQLRPGDAGTRLGALLAFAWAASPWAFFTLALNTNDGLVAMLLVATLLALSSPFARAALLALAGAAKFGPLALAPLVTAGRRPNGPIIALGLVALVIVVVAVTAPLIPPDGVRVFYDATIGFQLRRDSFWSIWSQYPEVDVLRYVILAATVAGAVALFRWPRARSTAQVGALGAAVLIGLQLTVTHWFYFYVVWFLPLVFVALLAPATKREAA